MVRILSSLMGLAILPTAILSQECSLECPTDAPCTMGSSDLSAHTLALGDSPTTNENGMHCACPYGWTGILCDHKYESCDEGHKCYHGGECVPGMKDKYGNAQLFCDCINAVESDETRYVGKYCETPFEKLCDANGENFCVNGGDCNPQFPTYDANPCICPNSWEGRHCEFKTGTVPDCTLDCKNDGLCVVGIRNPTDDKTMHHVWSQKEIDDHMQCLCTNDFGGPLCEASSEDCGGDACYHGGTCVETEFTNSDGVTTQEFHCDCITAAGGDNVYAGKYCQYPSTKFCSDTDDNLFCTNGGTCSSDPLKGCDCPAGYKGFKCEYRDESHFDDEDDDGLGAEKCGDVYCFNNGECVTTRLTLSDGTVETQQSCDCSHTYDDVHYWAGSSCQYKSTDICDNDGMFCVHFGECPTLENDKTCECQDGWEGDHCEIHIYALEDEYPDAPQCGERACLNGGQCVETRVSKGSETTFEFHCDCSTAHDNKFHFAGESCQYPSTQVCTHDEKSLEGQLFCTNHGKCQDDPDQGCKCPAAFKGFSCEFEDTTKDPVIENQPDGYDTCGDDLVCHNGGTCVTSLFFAKDGTSTSTESKHCDCSTAGTETTAFAGEMCEYEASKFCTKPMEGLGLESTYFCVNNGECNPKDVRQGCVCPSGWTGFRCEFAEEVEDLVDNTEDTTQKACGDLTCYNNGKCESIQTTDTVSGQTTTLYECDCSQATDGSSFFAGPQCEYKSNDTCSEQNPAGSFCVNGGTCKGGALEGCNCPSGWTGYMCDVIVKDDQHADQGKECGNTYCYNGGTCIQTQINTVGGAITEYHCDCDTAFDDTRRYGGLSCEHKSTSFCSRSNQGHSLAGVIFCTNEGVCDENPDRGCNCPAGWTGLACEFADEPDEAGEAVDESVKECGDLACLNGGQCVTTKITNANGEKQDMYHCDCVTAFTDTDAFAGPQCEYKQTAFCSEPAQGEDLSVVNFCTNGGICRENILSGCDCPDAFFGFRCEYQRDASDLVDKADDAKVVDAYVQCGDDYCYNGGTCETSVLGNGNTDYRCLCDTAATGSTLFSGKNCQYEMTSLCTKGTLDSLNSADFCVNNGKCPEGDDDLACSCPSGYTGFRCDEPIYKDQDNEDNIVPNDPDEREDDTDFYRCKLDCKNGSVCAKGAKDLSNFRGAVDHVAHLNQTYDQEYFEHCVCKEGWFGLECEHKAEVCGADEHLCLHGSKCVKNNQHHGCDCSQADEQLDGSDNSLFAGDSCQHPATDICTYGKNAPGRPLFFCTNQGTCNDYVSPSDPDPGCTCQPGWTGPHCEMRTDAPKLEATKPASNSTIMLGLAIFCLVIGTIAFSYIFLTKQNKDQSSTCMPFRRRRRHSGFDPTNESNNIAPKRSVFASSPDDMNPPPSRTFASRSGSDPMTAFQLSPDDEPDQFRDEPRSPFRDEPTSQYRDTPLQDDPDDEPGQDDDFNSAVLVSLGQPQDEDGNRLDNVDFI